MRDKLKKLDLKLTELSKYFEVSRPTMYKFLDMYVNGERDGIHENILHVLDYISNDNTVSKVQVISYILNQKGNQIDPSIKVNNIFSNIDDDRDSLKDLYKVAVTLDDNEVYHLIEYIKFMKGKGIKND